MEYARSECTYLHILTSKHHLVFSRMTAAARTPLYTLEESQFKLPRPIPNLLLSLLLVFSCQAPSLSIALKRREDFVSCHLTPMRYAPCPHASLLDTYPLSSAGHCLAISKQEKVRANYTLALELGDSELKKKALACRWVWRWASLKGVRISWHGS